MFYLTKREVAMWREAMELADKWPLEVRKDAPKPAAKFFPSEPKLAAAAAALENRAARNAANVNWR